MPARVLPAPVKPPNVVDDYRYGWREVEVTLPDGKQRYKLVPLTLEQALHPQFGDRLESSNVQDWDRIYLYNVLRSRLYRDPRVYVSFDQIIKWHIPELRDHNPDGFVAFDVVNRDKERKSFDVVKEGVRPTLIMEIVSPDYRYNDVITKFDEYYQANVPYYVIVDRLKVTGPVFLHGYRWTPEGWDEIPLDHRGWLWLECVNLWLVAEGNRVFFVDPDTEEEIPDDTEVRQQLEDANSLLADEVRERRDAEARAEAAAREQREAEARAEQDGQARREAEARAEQDGQARREAEARAEQDGQARREAEARTKAAEERIRQLEEELRGLQGRPPND